MSNSLGVINCSVRLYNRLLLRADAFVLLVKLGEPDGAD